MTRYMVMVRFKNEPGAAVGPMYLQAVSAAQAIEIAKSMYGPLLLSEYAMVAN